jgi:hypothetical protein
MKNIILSLSIVLILGGCALTNNEVACQLDTKPIEKNINTTKESMPEKKTQIEVELYYNGRTGELYPIFTNDNGAHTCVWYISGDHGSDSVVITREGNMYNMESYDYMGHLLSNNIEIIKSNNFLPPRVPIYVTCVDWQNNSYYGEYKFNNN